MSDGTHIDLVDQLNRSLAVVQRADAGGMRMWRALPFDDETTDCDSVAPPSLPSALGGGEWSPSQTADGNRDMAPRGDWASLSFIALTNLLNPADPTTSPSAPPAAAPDAAPPVVPEVQVTRTASPAPEPTPPQPPVPITVDGHTISPGVGLTTKVNKQVRQLLLRQTLVTNRFVGSPLARHAEQAYTEYVTRNQLPKMRLRLTLLALLVPLVSLAHAPRSFSTNMDYAYVLLTTATPAAILMIAAVLCSLRSTRKWWRTHVFVSVLLADSCIVWSDAILDFTDFTPRDKDFHTMWEFTRMLVMICGCSTLFVLELRPLFALLITQFLFYTVASIVIYVNWWYASGQGPWTWDMHHTSIESPESGLIELNRSCVWLRDHQNGVAGHNLSHSSVLLDCILLSMIALLTVLAALRRINLFERISFVNSFVLQTKVTHQSQLLAGQRVELLALFSNPSLGAIPAPLAKLKASLGPLPLGRELKSLLRAVPQPYVYIEPAATLSDVCAAMRQHNPQIAFFSGHSFMGSLVFELPDGTVDLPPADAFIEALRVPDGTTSRLRCLVLNGCETLDLAIEIVKRLPELQVVAWASPAEDSAARAFASGFYKAIGADLLTREHLDVKRAYGVGLSTFVNDGFSFGNPTHYFHPPDHPHQSNPWFDTCAGCSPPVHGRPVLVSNSDSDGIVYVRAGNETWRATERGTIQTKFLEAIPEVAQVCMRDTNFTSFTAITQVHGLTKDFDMETASSSSHSFRETVDSECAECADGSV